MNAHRLGLLVTAAATAALALSACSSSTAGTGSAVGTASGATASAGSTSSGGSSGSSGSSPSAGSSGGSSSGGTADSAAALGALLQQGLASTSSAHISLQITTSGQSITGSGVERLSDGKVTALDLTETIGSVSALRIIQIDGKTFVKLPTATSGKPYALVSASSSNPTVRSIASSLDATQSSASAGNAGVFAAAADSVTSAGTVSIGGVQTTHYSMVVNTAKLPSTYPGRSALVQAGVTSLPVELYVDGQGHPARVTEKVAVAGQSVDTTVLVTDYNQPVTITAPPASEVSTN